MGEQPLHMLLHVITEFALIDPLLCYNRKEMGVSINGGTPIAGWIISWKIALNWMMTGGTPNLGNLQILLQPSRAWL